MHTLTPSTTALQLLDGKQAWQYRAVPLSADSEGVLIATDMVGSEAVRLKRRLEALLALKIELQPVDSDALEQALATSYRGEGISKTESGTKDVLARLLAEATDLGASDIHLEPFEDRVRIRMRVDGILLRRKDMPTELHSKYVNLIKVRANLDIAQSRLPQDGRIQATVGDRTIDLRISTLPTFYGEKVVMRLLERQRKAPPLHELNMTDTQLRAYREGLSLESGVILISGPTGSGKTTTLYSTLQHLNTESVNITTVEDPVEYTVEGVNQSQLHTEIGMTFASALKSFLRQDPNIIMLGEIRDPETVEMALRASNTGHLVLSTIHTNSAWEIVSRLIDMGAETHLLEGTLRTLVAQRLLRKLCEHCSTWKDEAPSDEYNGVRIPWEQLPEKYKEAGGCSACHYTGYKGRFAIHEVISITAQVRKAIREKLSSPQVAYETLALRACHAIREGLTTVEEALPILLTGTVSGLSKISA